MLLVDVSASGKFGTRNQSKHELITELCAVLSFSAIANNDKAGVIFFSDKIEKFIPPKKGKSHILRIIRELIDIEPSGTGTDLAGALRYFTNVIKKRSIAFLITDFISTGYDDALKIASRKHDLAAIRIYDHRETEMPDMGMVRFIDAESGKVSLMDSSNASLRRDYAIWWQQHARMTIERLNRSGVDFTTLRTDLPYVQPLLSLFKKREKRF